LASTFEKRKEIKMKKPGIILTFIVLGVIIFNACTKEDSITTSRTKSKLTVYLTDAPFPIDLVSKTIVNIDKIEIRKQAADSSNADFIVLSEDPIQVDLLSLSNGLTEQLASVELDSGTYDMIRMHVTDSKVILKDNTEFDLKIPSGSSSGLKVKIDPSIEVSSGQIIDVLLDFDVSKSFVAKGNWKGGKLNGFNFKPVVRGILLGMAGQIEGTVTETTGTALEKAAVKVWLPTNEAENDSLITSSFTDSEGKYKVIGILSGTYYLTTELDSFQTDTVWNVNVTQGQSTTVDVQLVPEL